MRKYNILRCDVAPADWDVSGLIRRALKCGLRLVEVKDLIMDGHDYKAITYRGSRSSYIKYWGHDILKGNVALKALPGVIKLMISK